MRRVISESDDLGGGKNHTNSGTNHCDMAEKKDPINSNPDTNVIEPDGTTTAAAMVYENNGNSNNADDNNNIPLPVHQIGEAGFVPRSGSNSSLSGDDDDDPPLVVQQQQQQQQRPVFSSLPRMNSRESSGAESYYNNSNKQPGSQTSSRDWGWFEDVHVTEHSFSKRTMNKNNTNHGDGGDDDDGDDNNNKKDSSNKSSSDLDASMAVTAPNYVLEESLSSQWLWKHSAGQRPPQPVEERAFYEKMWAQNFARSQVDYNVPVEVLTAASPMSLDPFADSNFDDAAAAAGDYCHAPPTTAGGGDVAEAALMRRMQGHHTDAAAAATSVGARQVNKQVQDPDGEGNLTVLVRGDNVFGTTVSKSFQRTNEHGDPCGVDTINISIASYRVVESKKHGKYAQFLVIYREGSIRNTVGIWKRYSDFEELAYRVTQAHEGCAAAFANISPLSVAEEPETEHLPNAITSWRLLKKRKRWYRCLDAGYLSLKVFLLERFLHDILFESSSPQLLRDFVGVDSDLL